MIVFSEEIMSEFLSKNKELFNNKREFLTKLREVRQKMMNNGKPTVVPIKMVNNFEKHITNFGVQKTKRFFKSNIVVTSE